MTNTIFDVIDQLRVLLTDIGIKIYNEVKIPLETGRCFVLTYVPIKKTNISSTNDIVILLYIPKKGGLYDKLVVEPYCEMVSAKLKSFVAANGQINFNENVDPFTDNLDSNYTVTTFKIRTINY